MRILLVDDEPSFLSVIGSLLQASGHHPVTTSDARDVMRLIDLQDFDLICLDLLMPHINGLQLISGIHERRPDVPIVVISGVTDTRIGVEAAREGIEDYLLKPLHFDKLNAILKRLEADS